jgi:succinate dehydrogenase/fumarate reductase flavoprotein subunit
MGRFGALSPDVLIVGFGAAGASAAIAAHDAGASVAVVEKTASGGGNCVYSGGFLFEVDGPHALEHLDALCFGKTNRALLEAYARGLPEVPDFLESLGGRTEPAGWIKRGNDSGELAAAAGLDPAALQSTLGGYAAAVSRRTDHEFGRSPDTLVPLLPPLYAIEATPGVATASGGPRRDARARVLRPGGAPIPGLFAAGAAGSIWGHLTEHGGGLTDAIVFGRIAGAEAARVPHSTNAGAAHA